MIQLAPPPAHPLRRKAPVPPLFLRIVEQAFEAGDLSLPGCEVSLSVDNTLDMTSYMHRVERRGRIVLDWALVERALMFSSFFAKHIGTEKGYDHLRAYCRHETLLIASRKAAAAGMIDEAYDHHRLYLDLPSDWPLEHSANLDRQPRMTWAWVRYIVTHELAHHICRDLPHLPGEHWPRIEASAPPWPAEPDEDRAEELFCDHFALNCCWGKEERPFRDPPLGPVVLLSVYMALIGIGSAAAALAESPSLDEALVLFRVRDRRLRSHQLRSRLLAMAANHPEPAVAADCRRWKDIHELLVETAADGAEDTARLPPRSFADALADEIVWPKGFSEAETGAVRLAELIAFEEPEPGGR